MSLRGHLLTIGAWMRRRRWPPQAPPCRPWSPDFYHAGLTTDLQAVLMSPELAHYERIFFLGFSLGGHTVLRFAIESEAPRFVSVAAICAPLDLDAAALAIDRPDCWAYRRQVLASLVEIYAAAAHRRPVPTPVDRVRAAHKIRQFDNLVIAPRYGFRDAEEYYATQSVGPRLGDLRRPALLLSAAEDPMIPPQCVLPFIGAPAPGFSFIGSQAPGILRSRQTWIWESPRRPGWRPRFWDG